MPPPRLHLVDGTYELFRAHFAKRPSHTAPDGRALKATVGVVASMLALLEDPREQPTHLAVAFDNPIRSFRNDLYDGYKTDEGVPEELRAQFDSVEEGIRAIGVTVWSMDRWEADDALATGAARFRDRVDQVRIMTPDKDLGQCLMGKRVVQVDRMRDKEIDEEAMRKVRGVGPKSIPDLLALTGDTADGIPGVPGWGEVSAAALLSVYEHVDAIPTDPAKWQAKVRGAERLSASLNAHREEARLWRELATLIEDVPLKEDLADLEHKGVPRERFLAWCDSIGADRLRDRPKRFA
ncbi:MAG: 5'-3' exonuclease [Polyangiales bacterium]